MLGEVRDTLSDLRAEVSDQRGLVDTLEAYLERVAARTDVVVDFRHESTARLPLVQERELWRIAQEAITNVERHARATHLRVRWKCDGRSAQLTVADDGRGFPVERAPPGRLLRPHRHAGAGQRHRRHPARRVRALRRHARRVPGGRPRRRAADPIRHVRAAHRRDPLPLQKAAS